MSMYGRIYVFCVFNGGRYSPPAINFMAPACFHAAQTISSPDLLPKGHKHGADLFTSLEATPSRDSR